MEGSMPSVQPRYRSPSPNRRSAGSYSQDWSHSPLTMEEASSSLSHMSSRAKMVGGMEAASRLSCSSDTSSGQRAGPLSRSSAALKVACDQPSLPLSCASRSSVLTGVPVILMLDLRSRARAGGRVDQNQ